MPEKKKKGSSARPELNPQNSMIRDIEAARKQNLEHISSNESLERDNAEDGLDVADQLMATLEARDRAAINVDVASRRESLLEVPDNHHHPRKSKSNQSATSGHSSQGGSSPMRSTAEALLHAGEKIFKPNHSKSPPPTSSPSTSATSPDPSQVDNELASDMKRRGSIRERLFGSSHGKEDDSASNEGTRKVSRQQARKERKAAEAESQRIQAEEELKANGGKPDEAEKERVAITELCKALNVEMKEITPDGHCLYAALADQLNLHGHKGMTYQDTRKVTAEFMKSHADDFMPFISDSDEHMAGIENTEAGSPNKSDTSKQQQHFLKYCDAVESTGVWGGQPEILAMSRAFKKPIHVVQAGSPVVKVGEEEKGEPLTISYHRRMYGLGEHYNSLHKVPI